MASKFLMIDTDLRECRKSVRLELVLHKPEGSGPFPLFVMNHGSTGTGANPKVFRQTWSTPSLAQFFVARGWMVAFPQRRGRGKSDGLYDEGFMPDRSRYSGDRNQCLLGADRALSDIAAAIDVLRKRPDVQSGPLLIGGQSRGGILSIAYAGKHPQQVKGVINFVGGWTGAWRSSAAEVNAALFQQGGKFPAPTLWLYGDNDPVYPLTHSKENFRAFQAAGGKGKFVEFREVPELNGHQIIYWPQLWKAPVDEYLTTIDSMLSRG